MSLASMPSSILIKFSGVVVMVVLACSLAADRSTPDVRISYVGAWPEASDPVYKRFRQALAKRHPQLSEQAVFRHYQAETGNRSMLAQALQQALAQHPSVLVTPTGESAMAAVQHAGATPLVFSSFTNPISAGIRDTLQSTRLGNTGVMLRGEVDGKRLEILKDSFTGIRKVAVLADRAWAQIGDRQERLAQSAASLGLTLTFIPADSLQEVDAQMKSSSALSHDAWYIPASYIAYAAEKQIIGHLRKMKVPAMHATTNEVRAGAVMAYEEDTSFAMDALADLVARVCAGESAGSIPVERPRRYTLAVRVSDAAEPPFIDASVIRRADLVIREQ